MSSPTGVSYRAAQFFCQPSALAKDKGLSEGAVRIGSIFLNIITLGIPYLISSLYLQNKAKSLAGSSPDVRRQAGRVKGAVDPLSLTSSRQNSTTFMGPITSSENPASSRKDKEQSGQTEGDKKANNKNDTYLNQFNADIRHEIFIYLDLKDLLKMKNVVPEVKGLDAYILSRFSLKELISYQKNNPEDPFICDMIIKFINEKNPSLRVDLQERNDFNRTPNSLYALFDILGERTNELKVLDLSGYELYSKDFGKILSFTPNIESIKFQFIVESNKEGAKPEEYLVHLPNLKTLTSINLNCCTWLTDEGMKILASMTRLRSISITSARNVTKQGLSELKALKDLHHLDLCGTGGIKESVISEIVSQESFRSLDLTLDHRLKNFSLANVLQNTNRLTHLYIQFFTPMNDSDMDAVLRQTNLEVLVIRGCSDVSDLKFRELTKLSKLKVIHLEYADNCPADFYEPGKDLLYLERLYIYDNDRKVVKDLAKPTKHEIYYR